jgi:uncharacterized damage-inducible protein DinB
MNLSDIRRLFDYTEWANALAMDATSKLNDEDLRRDVGMSLLHPPRHLTSIGFVFL